MNGDDDMSLDKITAKCVENSLFCLCCYHCWQPKSRVHTPRNKITKERKERRTNQNKAAHGE